MQMMPLHRLTSPGSAHRICSVLTEAGRRAGGEIAAGRLLLTGFLFGAGNVVAGLFFVLLEGDVDDRPRAKKEQQCPEHCHGDLIEAIEIHDLRPPERATCVALATRRETIGRMRLLQLRQLPCAQ